MHPTNKNCPHSEVHSVSGLSDGQETFDRIQDDRLQIGVWRFST